jgi:hypothetical protein
MTMGQHVKSLHGHKHQMALIKSIETQFGENVFACYWNISKVADDFQSKVLDVFLLGYSSETARRTGKNAMATALIKFEGTEYVADAKRRELYLLLKNNQAFADATDS